MVRWNQGTRTLYLIRAVEAALLDRLSFMRVVALVGPRQAGKSTLSRALAATRTIRYETMDDPSALSCATDDPTSFLRHDVDTLVIDEVQRAPEIILPLKLAVDLDPRPGRYLLTGSADVFGLRRTQDSLAGRLAELALLPLSQSEILGRPSHFLDLIFEGQTPRPADPLERDLETIVATGGYPAQIGLSPRARRGWMEAYLSALIARDVRTVSNVHDLDSLAPLIEQLAWRAGDVLNLADVGRVLGMPERTVDQRIGLLEKLFLVRRVRPWFRNELNRLAKSPKLHFLDSGLAAHLRTFDPSLATNDRTAFGPLLETFVFGELTRLASAHEQPPRILHMRTREALEVDFILERSDRKIVAIEVKAGRTFTADWARPMKAVRDAIGSDFVLGLILHGGDRAEVLNIGDRIVAAPISVLWGERP